MVNIFSCLTIEEPSKHVEWDCNIVDKHRTKQRKKNLRNHNLDMLSNSHYHEVFDDHFKRYAHKDIVLANQFIVLLPENDERIEKICSAYSIYPGSCDGCRIARRYFLQDVNKTSDCFCADCDESDEDE